MTPDLSSMPALALDASVLHPAARVVLALLAAGVCLRGASWGRHAIRIGVALCGPILFVAALAYAELPGQADLVLVAHGGAMLAAGLALFAELLHFRVGLALSGLVSGALWGAAVATAFGMEPSGVALAVPALAAGAAMPWILETLPRFLLPVTAAPALLWAVGVPTSLPLLVGATAVGILVQFFTGPETRLLDEGTVPA